MIGKQFNPEIEIWFGEGNGTFTFLKDIPTPSPDAYDFVLADVNKDGNVDIVNVYNDDTSSYAVIYLNDGSANFTTVTGPIFSGFVSNFSVGDFDRD